MKAPTAKRIRPDANNSAPFPKGHWKDSVNSSRYHPTFTIPPVDPQKHQNPKNVDTQKSVAALKYLLQQDTFSIKLIIAVWLSLP
jgi:hypothetical protein